MKQYILPVAALLILGAGCTSSVSVGLQPTSTVGITTTPVKQETTLTYYTSAKPYTTFCNGTDMNSAGYKQSLTEKNTKTVPGVLLVEDIIKNTLISAANNSDFVSSGLYTRIASTTFSNGVVTVRPASGWAGSSIFMCAWQPFVEKQLETIPEVKQIKWEAQS